MNNNEGINSNKKFEILKKNVVEFEILCLFFVTIFLGFIVKFMPFPSVIYQITNSITDLLPLITFFIFGKIDIKNSNKFYSIYFILLATIFSAFLLIVTLLNNGNPISALLRLGAIFRFLPLCLLISSLELNYKKRILNTFLILTKYAFFLEIGIGILEITGGEKVMTFFLPFIANKSSSAQRVISEGQIFGTFANTIDYALFIVAAFSILITFQKIKLKSVITFLTIIVIYFSGSVVAFALIFISIYIFSENSYKKYLLILSPIPILFLGIRFYSFYQGNLIELYAGLINSRLGMIIFTLPEYLNTGLINSIFGIGADQNIIFQVISNLKTVPLIFQSDQSVVALDDVYYVSTIVQSGFIGLTILIIIFLKIYRILLPYNIKENNKEKKLILFLLFMIASGSLFNQILHVRSFSILFWITISILNISNLYTTFPKKENENTSSK